MMNYLHGFMCGYLRKAAGEAEGFEPETAEPEEEGGEADEGVMGDVREEAIDAMAESALEEPEDETHRQAVREIYGVMPKEARDRRAFESPTERSGPIMGSSEHDQGMQSTMDEDTNPVLDAIAENGGKLDPVHRELDVRNTTDDGAAGAVQTVPGGV